MAEIKGKIHVIADRDNNNQAIYKILHPETETAQITDYTSATDTRIDNKISTFFNSVAENTYLHTNANAVSATKLATARSISIKDASSTNTGTAISFDGTNTSTLYIKLPSTIKASLTGNADTATKLANARSINIQDSSATNTGTAISFDGSSTSTLNIKLPATIKASLTGNANTATELKTAREIGIADADVTNIGTAVNFNGASNVMLKLPATIKASLTGNASTATKLKDKVTIAISGGATGTATNFDGSDSITIPVTSLDATKLSGTASIDTTGNAATATNLKNSRTLKISDADATNTGAGTSFNGSAAVTIALPGTIKASLTGNADTATKLASKKSINISDADGTNTGTSINFDGSEAGIIKLPSTIKASLSGNASSATKATQDGSGNNIVSTYAPKASPALTGTPTAPTAALGTATTQIATTAFVNNALSNLVGAAPETLDTLAEIANAINNDKDVYDTLDEAISKKQDKHAALTSISGLSTSANKMIYTTASNTYATTTLTELGRNLLDDVDAAAMRTTIDALGKTEKAVSAATADVAEECTGNAATATALKTGRNINISDASSTNTGTAISFNGTSAGTIKLPATIKATLTGNASTATKLANARSINIQDASSTNTGTAISFDGSSTSTLYIKLPATIKASLTGNADTATNAANDSSGNNIISTYETKANAITGLSINDKTITYTKGDGATGTISTQDKRVTQTVTTINTTYPILLSNTANRTATATEGARFGSGVKVNPSTSTIIANIFQGSLEGTADKAIQDNSGNTIDTTYETKANAITNLSVSGKTVTYTKGDGTTGTITTQDTDTLVTQNVSATNTTYPILATPTANATANQGAKTAIFGKGIKINPSTSVVYATTFSGNLSGTAAKATGDSSGNNIISTYERKDKAITDLAISGQTITYTKGNGATGTITTQDGNLIQTISSTDSVYPLLATARAGATDTITTTSIFSKDITINPSANSITATTFNGNLSGTAAKATGDGSGNNIISTYATKAGAVHSLSASGKTITFKNSAGTSLGTFTTQDTTYSAATSTTPGLMTAADRIKLDSITESADTVAFAQSLTSGTAVGTIVINGTSTVLYCHTNTDTHNNCVSFTSDTSATTYPLLFKNTTGSTTTAAGTRFNTNIYATPSTGTVTATQFNGKTNAVSFTPSLTSGTAVGTIVINDTSTTLYCHTNTDTHNNCVSFTSDTSATTYPLLFKNTTGSTTTAAGTRFNTNIYATPSTGTVTATQFNGKTNAVSFTPSLTSGTAVGTIVINGTSTVLYCQTNTDTHWTTHLIAGASATATVNAAVSSGNVFVNALDNSTVRNSLQLKAGSNMTITSDANGIITFTSSYTNTDTKVAQNISTANSTYPILLTPTANATANVSATNAIFGSGVKVNPSTGVVTATQFNGKTNAVTFTQSLTSGTAVGTIVINGTSTVLYCQTNTNTDTLVTQNTSAVNATYPILATPTANATANQGAKTAIFGSGIKINPSSSAIYATTFVGNVTGNVSGSSGSCTGLAAKATGDSSGNNIISTYTPKYTYTSVTIAKTTTTTESTAGSWYTVNTTINGIQYKQYYQVNVSGLKANDTIEADVTANGHIARAAGVAPFVQSFANCFRFYAMVVPSNTFTVKYKIFPSKT